MPKIWLPEIIEHIAQHLDDNEVACTLRVSRTVPAHAFHNFWTKPNAVRPFAYNERRKLLALTAASGCLPNLEVAVQHAGCDLAARPFTFWSEKEVTAFDPLAAAASAGHVHVCEWLLQHGCCLTEWHLRLAARAGHQEVCAWLLDRGCSWDVEAVYAAAKGGHPGLMEWLRAQFPEAVDARELLGAVAEGYDLATLQRLYSEEGDDPERWNLCRLATRPICSPTSDWQAKILWLEQMGITREYYWSASYGSMAVASLPDAVERLQWLQARGYSINMMDAVHTALVSGNMATLEYLTSSLDARAFQENAVWFKEIAAKNGQLTALKLLLHALGPLECPLKCLSEALKSGHLEVVAWLVEEAGVTSEQLQQGVDNSLARIDEYLLYDNAYTVELLEWLHARGCRMTEERALKIAAAVGREEVIEWLLAHGYCFLDDGTTYHKPIVHGDLATLRCLWRLGCVWGPGARARERGECPPGVRAWLDETGLDFD